MTDDERTRKSPMYEKISKRRRYIGLELKCLYQLQHVKYELVIMKKGNPLYGVEPDSLVSHPGVEQDQGILGVKSTPFGKQLVHFPHLFRLSPVHSFQEKH